MTQAVVQNLIFFLQGVCNPHSSEWGGAGTERGRGDGGHLGSPIVKRGLELLKVDLRELGKRDKPEVPP